MCLVIMRREPGMHRVSRLVCERRHIVELIGIVQKNIRFNARAARGKCSASLAAAGVNIDPTLFAKMARESKKTGKKLFMCSGALAFVLFFLPVTMPWQIQKDLYWHHAFTPVLKRIDVKNCLCLCSKDDAPFFSRFFPRPVLIIGSGKNEIPPAGLKAEVEKLLKNSDVMIVGSSRQIEKHCPFFAGQRYRTGKFNLYYYYKHGVDKK